MDLKFTDEQNMMRDMTRNLCTDHSSVALVRQMENDTVGLPAGLWQQMSQTGLTGIRVPEQYGGMGMGLLDAAVVFEQLGRHLAPGPLFASSIMSAGALVHGGAAFADLLGSIASGQTGVVPAGPNAVAAWGRKAWSWRRSAAAAAMCSAASSAACWLCRNRNDARWLAI